MVEKSFNNNKVLQLKHYIILITLVMYSHFENILANDCDLKDVNTLKVEYRSSNIKCAKTGTVYCL